MSSNTVNKIIRKKYGYRKENRQPMIKTRRQEISKKYKRNPWWVSMKLMFYRLSVSKDLKDRLEVPRIILYGLLWGAFNPIVMGYLLIWVPANFLLLTQTGLDLFSDYDLDRSSIRIWGKSKSGI